MGKTSYFYVLYCRDGTLYGGYTTDLERREQEHNSGLGAKYTKPEARRPAKMIYAEGFATRSEATKAEAAFKKQTRMQKERFLKKQGVQLPVHMQQTCVVKQRESANEPVKEEQYAESEEF